MKILIVSQYFWPENFKINDLAQSLRERGNEVTILTGKPNYPNGEFFESYGFLKKRTEYHKGIKIIRSPIFSRGNGNSIRLFANYLSFVFFSTFCVVFRLKKNNDVIFVYEPSPITVGIPAIVYKFFSKAPIFFWVQDLWPESLSAAGNIKSKFVLRKVDLLVKYIYKKSDIIFISSKNFRQSIIEKGVKNEKIVYLPNWAEDVYLNKFEEDEKIKKLFPLNGFKILFAGNIGDAQDFESIVNAAELTIKYKDIHWIIIGDGRKKKWIEQQILERNLQNIHLLGRFHMDVMPYFFNEADVLLVSLKDEYIFSLTVPAKIQSYLAFGRPILAMINGEGADIINDSKAGFAVNAGNYSQLSEKAIEMSKMSKNQLSEMSEKAKCYYLNYFDKNNQLDSILYLFNKAVENK